MMRAPDVVAKRRASRDVAPAVVSTPSTEARCAPAETDLRKGGTAAPTGSNWHEADRCPPRGGREWDHSH